MSSRKRHTESLDFMRVFMARELGLPGTSGLDSWNVLMIAKLEKRGWLQKKRTPSLYRGFRPVLQRRNFWETTPEGRRAVYRADRHADPVLREHSYDISPMPRRVSSQVWQNDWEKRIRNRVSANLADLHGKRRRK